MEAQKRKVTEYNKKTGVIFKKDNEKGISNNQKQPLVSVNSID